MSDASKKTTVGPFLKWAGGKGQLLAQFEAFYPQALHNGKIKRYLDPFVGGGAVFFEIAQRFEIPELIINDINKELALAYYTIQKDPEALIERLNEIEKTYHALDSKAQEEYFYETRAAFNAEREQYLGESVENGSVHRCAQIIFLNKTCYNGLFRVNSKGGFNVPFGRYKNPTICHEKNVRAVAEVLSRTKILHCDFSETESFVDEQTFVYFDPPYRPLNGTSDFTAYSKNGFNDAEQLRLAASFRKLHGKGAQLMLSNSDPKNADPNDTFFEDAYRGFQINRVSANRMINSKKELRGALSELVVVNYSTS